MRRTLLGDVHRRSLAGLAFDLTTVGKSDYDLLGWYGGLLENRMNRKKDKREEMARQTFGTASLTFYTFSLTSSHNFIR